LGSVLTDPCRSTTITSKMTNYIRSVLILPLVGCQAENKVRTYKNYIGSWSPDGKQILFYSDRNGNWDIFLIQADGTTLTQITTSKANEKEPNWLPLNNAYLFTSDTTGESKIYEHTVEGGETTLITNARGRHAAPAMSPTGTHYAYLIEENVDYSSQNIDGYQFRKVKFFGSLS
jgi:Tol biopolymer transport system component